MSRSGDNRKESIPQGFPNHLQVWREIFVDFQHQNRDYFLPHQPSFSGMIARKAIGKGSCEKWEERHVMREGYGGETLCGEDRVSFTHQQTPVLQATVTCCCLWILGIVAGNDAPLVYYFTFSVSPLNISTHSLWKQSNDTFSFPQLLPLHRHKYSKEE